MVSPPNGDEGMLVLEKRGSQRTSPELLDFTSSVLSQSIPKLFAPDGSGCHPRSR
jgi:hypothetical protein